MPRQLFVVPEMKSFEYPDSEWFTVAGRLSSGAVSQRSPVSPPPEQLPPLQVCAPEQVLHVSPPKPHAALEVPAWHTSPWQQPEGQVVLLQVATHELPLQAWLLLQVEHVAPPEPHAPCIVPAWHTLPWQQPVGQVVELQAATHVPPLHIWLLLQEEHVLPPEPHAPSEVPAWHTLPWQQPLGQVVTLQVETETHWPALQLSLEVQVSHSPPPVPQVLLLLGWHTLFAQQPPGQVAALQMNRHCPPAHESEPEQVLQVLPAVPHALVEVPLRQTPASQQPLGQVAALQTFPPEQRPPLQVCPLAHTPQVSPPSPHAEVEEPV